MVDKELFSTYVRALEETQRARTEGEELSRRIRDDAELLQSKVDEWNAKGPHDPSESMGTKEHSKAVRAVSQKMAQYRLDWTSVNNRVEDELVARAQEMLKSGNYDLKDVLDRRIEEMRRRLNEQWPKLVAIAQEHHDASSRYIAFIDRYNAKE